jgi:hypothetical protein
MTMAAVALPESPGAASPPPPHDALGATTRAIEAGLATPGAMDDARFDAFLQNQRMLGLVQGDRPLCHHLSPFVISGAEYARIGRAAEHVVSALERVGQRSLRDARVAEALGLSREERELAAIDPGYPGLLTVGRLDMLMHGDGFSFIELNADSPGGVVDQLLVERTLFELPHLSALLGDDERRFETPRPHDAVLDALLGAHLAAGGSASPTIALVDFATTETLGEIMVLVESFSRRGYRTVFADPAELSYEGRRLTARGEPIDLVYRRVLVKELLERHGLGHPLFAAYRDHAVCVANSFRTKALNKKAAFALLGDPEYADLFTHAEREAIRLHVPWTRRLIEGPAEYHGTTVDLFEMLQRDQERFVIKPNDEYGGQGVVLGWTASPAEWTRALENAKDSCVVQERRHARRIRMPTYRGGSVEWEDVYFDLCPFVFGGKMEGGIVRLSTTGITNVSAGACVSTLLVARDDGGAGERGSDV